MSVSRSSRIVCALLLPILLQLSFSVFGQDAPKRQFGPWVWGLQGVAWHQFETDLSDADAGANFSLSHAFIQGSFGYAWDRRNSISLAVGMGESDYDFSSGANIEGQQPWGKIRDYRISVPMRFSPSDKANVIIVPSVRSYVEKGASEDDGRTEGVLAGFGWKFSDTLTIGPGFGWFTELGGGSSAFPIIFLNWAITEKLSLSTGQSPGASQGPGLTMNYSLSDKWTLALSGRYEKATFALDVDDDREMSASFGQDKNIPVVVSAQYSPWPMTSVSIFAGSKFDGELSLENENRNAFARSDYDTPIMFGLSFRSRF
jgi:hypothetical protein